MRSRIRTTALLALLAAPLFGQGWTDLSGTHLYSACPTGASAPPGNCQNVVGAWSGGVADTLRNRLIVWGGGHNDYYGNEVYALNLNANPVTLTRLNNPSPPTSSTNTTAAACVSALSDGAANSRHSYNGVAYVSSADRMLAFGGTHACMVGGENYTDLWTLSLSGLASNSTQNNWTAMDPVTVASGSQPSQYYWGEPPVLLYDPAGDLVYIWQATIGNVWSYKYSTNTYTQLGTMASCNSATGVGCVPFTASAVLYPPTKTVYFFGNNSTAGSATTSASAPAIYSMSYGPGSNWTATPITSSVTGCGPLASAMDPGLAYDTALQKIVGWPNFGNTVYIFDPTTNSCTSETFPSGPPDSTDGNGNQYTTGTYGRFQYFPALDAFAVVNSATSDAYLLRLSAASGTTTTPLPAISSFVVSAGSIAAGASATLTWVTSGATSVSISPSVGSVALSGSVTVSPSSTTTYTLTATNGTVSMTSAATITVTLPATGTAPAISSFTASPSSVSAGQAATLSWVTSGATAVAISPGTFTATTASGSTSVSPSATTTYTLTATNAFGSTTAQTTVSLAVTSTSSSSTAPLVSDTLTITNSGATASNYPVQIGRPFAQGEFPNGQLPQATLGATALSTQVDVKSRWPDGSLKHAILSFLIPTFAAGQSYTIALTAGATVGNTALTQAQMMGAAFNFDAQIQLTENGTTKSASARTMLANGDYTVWASGPIATTIILANHAQTAACGGKAASKYDFGFDSYCPFRPEFEATFWPATNQVLVRYIGEIADTEQMEDVPVSSVTLTLGSSPSSSVYSLTSSVTMGALTRWTMSYWLNGTPPAAGINHNLAYLASTRMVPNYDNTRTIPSTTIAGAYSTFQAKPTADIYDAADFTMDQTAPGARNYPADEIGPYTGPEVMWLYSGDYRAQKMAIRYAELSGAWPVHWREGNSTKYIDRAHTVSGLGHWMSVSSRPTYCSSCGSGSIPSRYFNYSGIATADKVNPVGAIASSGWVPDVAHEPDWTPIYLLTGDYYFLEEAWAWATTTELFTDGSRSDYVGRGPSGVYGHLPGNSWYGALQVRGTGWGLRNVVETVSISPDGSPEQSYYDLLVQDTLAAWEGERNITTGTYNGNTMWTWGNQFANPNYCATHPAGVGLWCANPINGVQNGVPTAIHFWVPDGGTAAMGNSLCQYPIDTTQANNLGCTSPWMVQYVIYALGRAKDLGYPSQALLSWIAPWIISQVTDPTFNPYLVGAYRQGTVQANGQYYTTWAGILGAMCSSTATGCVTTGSSTNAQTAQVFDPPVNQYGGCAFNGAGDGACSAVYEASMAIAQVADQTNGTTAWNWINTNGLQASAAATSLASDPKWDILPRAASSTTTSSGSGTTTTTSVSNGNSCDLNGDGVVNSTDVQLAINQVLGIAACSTADLLHTGQCTVVDVQLIINASMGQGCLTN